jgi:hypothetical protein
MRVAEVAINTTVQWFDSSAKHTTIHEACQLLTVVSGAGPCKWRAPVRKWRDITALQPQRCSANVPGTSKVPGTSRGKMNRHLSYPVMMVRIF